MRAVVQRVSRARVQVAADTVGTISRGLVVLLGIHGQDGPQEVQWMADKVVNLRIFPDAEGKMNLSLADISGEMLIISQFTLYGDCRKGRRPGYSTAAPPELANRRYEEFVEQVKALGIKVGTGIFQAEMAVELVNDGPVTLMLDSEKLF